MDLLQTLQHSSAVWGSFWSLRAAHCHICPVLILGPQPVWRLHGEEHLPSQYSTQLDVIKKKGHIRKKVITFVLAVIYLPLSLEIDRINLNKITVVTSLWRCVCHLLLPLSVSYRSTWSLCCSSRMTAADRGRWPAVSSITVCRCLWPCSPLSCPSSLRSCGRDSNRSDPDPLPRTTACVYSRIPPPLNW